MKKLQGKEEVDFIFQEMETLSGKDHVFLLAKNIATRN